MRYYSRKAIEDEFTNLPISRERKRQLRKVKSGVCRIASCNQALVHGQFCKKHYDERQQYKKEQYKKELRRKKID